LAGSGGSFSTEPPRFHREIGGIELYMARPHRSKDLIRYSESTSKTRGIWSPNIDLEIFVEGLSKLCKNDTQNLFRIFGKRFGSWRFIFEIQFLKSISGSFVNCAKKPAKLK
jgi:hypothetical protein